MLDSTGEELSRHENFGYFINYYFSLTKNKIENLDTHIKAILEWAETFPKFFLPLYLTMHKISDPSIDEFLIKPYMETNLHYLAFKFMQMNIGP